ncbi:multi-sensor signal transduction histidine kinase [Desulfobulbus propionicus DSM 2032]|jgi:two-component system phosphate regulon sensor histidine kinase PhoR|uniref:histidine kinase n=1 Tax=Desulfobulbus propionicus (strain ATCC 33891 / DSM 2032 / VKM B-1956 / 1pr3) TaxID=577650 RepID=A0A7U4DQW4_DESPD|nr:ATP-binding protein [Desulfobulbus propionicus]ADW19462.1 multi-sensor signal transduction histidine kinase [Desulfobulbus propionicus DSM 2032]
MRNIRLFWQIFPACVGITLFSLLLAAWLATTTGRDFYIEHLKEEIRERALLIEPTIATLSRGEDRPFQDFVRQTGRRAATRITVIANNGLVRADSNEDHNLMDNHATRPEVVPALAGETGYSLRHSRTLGESMLYAAIPVRLGEEELRGALRLAIAITPVEIMLATLHKKLLAIGLAVAVLAALLSLYSARRISRPLEEIKRGAEQLTKGRIDQLVKINSEHMSAEMAGLAGSINQMAEQINRRIRIIIQQRNQLEAVFSSMADAVVAIDADKKIIRMNQAAAALFGLPSEGVKGKAVQGVIRNPYLLEMVDCTLAHNTPQEQKVTLFNGTDPILLDTHAVPLRDEDDRSMGVLLVMNDLTKLNRLENIRQDFVANVSHELKTPITAIKGYVETLLDGALEDQDNARRFLSIVVRQANRLDAIVDDLLTLSRIEDREQRRDISLTVAEVGPVLESALQTCAVQADEKGIIIQVESDEEWYAPINQPLLEQAVINLLGNAIAYSPQGSLITLRCQGSRNRQGEEFVHLSVIDNGPGIAKEHLPRLFERFYRCDKARSRDQGGTGLGLAIAKHIAQAHNGTVEVESSLGKGSTFTLILPAAPRNDGERRG